MAAVMWPLHIFAHLHIKNNYNIIRAKGGEFMNSQRTVQVIRPLSETLTEKQKIRAAAYCRVSTDSDSQEDSFLAQVKYYTDFIGKREDMELVDIYADEGITGTEASKRDDFLRMLKDAKLRRLDRVFCKSISRFARNSLE